MCDALEGTETMDPDSRTQPNEEPPPLVDLPGFDPPTRPTLYRLDPATTTVTDLPPAIPEAPTFDRDELDADDPARFEQTSPRPAERSPRSAGDPTIAGAAAGLFALVASIVGFVANATIGRGSGAYLMAPEEAMAIGAPLGRIASRRAPIGDGDVTDVGDGIQAGVATAAYAARATMEHFGAPSALAPGEQP